LTHNNEKISKVLDNYSTAEIFLIMHYFCNEIKKIAERSIRLSCLRSWGLHHFSCWLRQSAPPIVLTINLKHRIIVNNNNNHFVITNIILFKIIFEKRREKK